MGENRSFLLQLQILNAVPISSKFVRYWNLSLLGNHMLQDSFFDAQTFDSWNKLLLFY